MKFIFEDKEIDLEVEFSIIYEFDISCQDKVGRYKPKPDSKFKLTECSDGNHRIGVPSSLGVSVSTGST